MQIRGQKIQKNIYVKDINISNLTKEEAKEKMKEFGFEQEVKDDQRKKSI